MDIKLYTNISPELDNIEIHIKAPELNENIINLEKNIKQLTSTNNEFIGFKDNDIFIIQLENIIKFYSQDKYIYCQTKDGNYRVKETLYYLEENLPHKNFIRISNSTIVNIHYVKCFNTSIIGKLIVKLTNNTQEDVSKRRIPEIMKFLKERKN